MDSSEVNNAIERIGLSSIVTTFGIKSAEAAEIVELSDTWILSSWGMPDYALAISMIGGVIFIINQILNAKVARETLKKLKHENKDK